MLKDFDRGERLYIFFGLALLIMSVLCLVLDQALPDTLPVFSTIRSARSTCPPLPTPLPSTEEPHFVGRIAFRASCGYGGQIDIFLLNGDGGIRNLTHSSTDELEFSWSPDGKRLAFASDRSGNFNVWVIDVDTGITVQLTNHTADDRQPSWSPDGKHIAFLSFRDAKPEEERGEVYIMNPDGSGQRRLTNNIVMRAGQKWIPWLNGEEHDLGVWSPDSQMFATNVQPGTTIFFLDGRPPLNINPDMPPPVTVANEPASDSVADWSPNGTHLLLYSNRGGFETDDWVMYVLDLDTQVLTRLVHQTGMEPRWSPDGEHILFRDNKTRSDDVYVINADGSNEVNLTPDSCNAVGVRWSPHGQYVSYSTICDGFKLFVMNADGTQKTGFLPLDQWLLHHHEWAPQP